MLGLEHRTVVEGSRFNQRALLRNTRNRGESQSVIDDFPNYEEQGSCTDHPAESCKSSGIEYRLACSRSDFIGAFELLQRRYQDAGLAASCGNQVGACRIRMMPYHRWVQSQVFVAAAGERIIGTVTLISAGQFDLPILDYYQTEIKANRAVGRISEITSLAVDPTHAKPTEVFGELTRRLYFFARYQGADSVAAIVHPRHAKFYQHAMGYQAIGDEVQCRQVCGEPGVGVLGSVNDKSKYRKRWQDYYFSGALSRDEMHPRPIAADEYSYCSSLADQANLHAAIREGMVYRNH